MDTKHTESPASSTDALFQPLAGWEAASRWNAATFDWMTRAWQQWIALMTVVPPRIVTTREPESTPMPTPLARPVTAVHAFARSEEARPARTKREAKPSAAKAEGRKRPSTKPAARAKAKSTRARG